MIKKIIRKIKQLLLKDCPRCKSQRYYDLKAKGHLPIKWYPTHSGKRCAWCEFRVISNLV